MEDRKAEIAELYFRSNSFQFGKFPLSSHLDQPGLPLSPYYLHYPKAHGAGSEFLPMLFRLIGEEFFEISKTLHSSPTPPRITGVPDGALAIAEEHAKHYDPQLKNILTFRKIGRPSIFIGPVKEPGIEYNAGDELIIDDDHTSAGRNKRLMLLAARSAGLVVNHMLTVVDRQQGGVENMASRGVKLLSIFTIDKLLEYEFGLGYISKGQIDEIEEYRANN